MRNRIGCIIRHWLPIVTFCPVNGLPDPIYVSLNFCDGKFHELYAVRKKVRQLLSWKKMYMEDVAALLQSHFPTATITVRLAFNRHVVIAYPERSVTRVFD